MVLQENPNGKPPDVVCLFLLLLLSFFLGVGGGGGSPNKDTHTHTHIKRCSFFGIQSLGWASLNDTRKYLMGRPTHAVWLFTLHALPILTGVDAGQIRACVLAPAQALQATG